MFLIKLYFSTLIKIFQGNELLLLFTRFFYIYFSKKKFFYIKTIIYVKASIDFTFCINN